MLVLIVWPVFFEITGIIEIMVWVAVVVFVLTGVGAIVVAGVIITIIIPKIIVIIIVGVAAIVVVGFIVTLKIVIIV